MGWNKFTQCCGAQSFQESESGADEEAGAGPVRAARRVNMVTSESEVLTESESELSEVQHTARRVQPQDRSVLRLPNFMLQIVTTNALSCMLVVQTCDLCGHCSRNRAGQMRCTGVTLSQSGGTKRGNI